MTHPAIVVALFFCSGLGGGFALAYLLQAEKTNPPVWKRWMVCLITLCVGYFFAGYMGSIANSPQVSSLTKGSSIGLLALGILLPIVATKYKTRSRKTHEKAEPRQPKAR